MKEIKQLAGQTLVYGLGTIVPRLLNYLILTPFFTRVFSPSQYGIFTELYSYVVFLLVLLTYGMETGFFRFASEKRQAGRVYTTSLISLFTTSAIFILISQLFADQWALWLDYEGQESYIKIFSLIVAIDAFSAIPFAKLRYQNKAFKFGWLKIASVLINVFFNLFFFIIVPRVVSTHPDSAFFSWYNPEYGVGYAFLANLIASSITLILLLPEIFDLQDKFDGKLWRQMLHYSFPLLLVGLAGMINEVFDKLVMKHLIEGEDALSSVGIYGANYKIAVLMTLFVMMFRTAAEPFFFSKMKQTDAKEIYAEVMRLFVGFGWLIFLFVMAYLQIIKYFIGEAFHEGTVIVPIILIANFFLGILYNLSVWYKVTNRTWYGALIAFIGALITILLNIILIPKLGYIGAAWATFICYFTMMIISYYFGRKFYRIPYNLKSIAGYSILALCLYTALYFAGDSSYWYLINTLIVSVYLVVFVKKEKLWLFLKKSSS